MDWKCRQEGRGLTNRPVAEVREFWDRVVQAKLLSAQIWKFRILHGSSHIKSTMNDKEEDQ